MFAPTRDEARRFFFDTWSKYQTESQLTDLEKQVLDIILMHPEYHSILDGPERYGDRDYTPEGGETNPFLHLSMHLALRDQIGIDQPPGIRQRYLELANKVGGEHEALHAMMDCLAEMIWTSQRYGAPFDVAQYLECLKRK
jgi:Domain of unknown function (DUF1841)